MILLKTNTTADPNNAVFISSLGNPLLTDAKATLTKYAMAFTNTTDVSTFEVGGVTYTLDAAIDVSTAAGAEALIAAIVAQLKALGYASDSENWISYDIDSTTTRFFTGFSQIVFDTLNATAFTTNGTTEFGAA